MRTTQQNFNWKNMHETSTAMVARLHSVDNRPASGAPTPSANDWLEGLSALRELSREVSQRGGRLRAQGGLWSLSEVARLEEDVVDLSAMNRVDATLPAGALDPTARASGRFVFAQAGVRVVDLQQTLDQHGLALPTSGASNGQSLAGAIATGTHGAAVKFGAMQDFVAAIHLVGADGEAAWIERATRPVVSDAFAALTKSRRVLDDALFEAALVSFGCFGVVHAFVLDVVDRYLLDLHVKRVTRKAMLQTLTPTGLDLTPLQLPGGALTPHHVELVVNPYCDMSDADGVVCRVMYERPWSPQPASQGGSSKAFSSDLIADVGKLAQIVGALPGVDLVALRAAVKLYLDSEIPDVQSRVAAPGVHFGDTSLRPGGISTELGVALGDLPATLSTLIDVARKHDYAGAFACRFVRPSRATLAFTRHGPLTCTIETPSINNAGTRAAIPAFWDELTKAKIPFTAHWGQLLPRDPAWVQRAYGASVGAWQRARDTWLTTPAARRMFSNELSDLLKLT